MTTKKELADRLIAAYNRGVEHGGMCNQNPWRFCEEFGVSVDVVPERQLQSGVENWRVLGRTFLPTNQVQISDELTPLEMRWTLAHELGHVGRVENGYEGSEKEMICESYAAGFTALVPTEQERWQERARKIEQEAHDRDRAMASLRSQLR